MIFVQIASYRDPELLPTIIDSIARAKYPNDLVFGICWQKDTGDHCLDPLRRQKRFRIDDVLWQESRGPCWARARIQTFYDGEEYTLHLDSHHRFAEHWDVKLMKACELTGSTKPIITSFAAAYDPKTNAKESDEPNKIVAERFTEEGAIPLRAQGIPAWEQLTKPIPARFVCNHFFFTLGLHCIEHKYEPRLYYLGTDISLSIRSFTLGYDLFHPHRTFIWHEYLRSARRKHWDDHIASKKVIPSKEGIVTHCWDELEATSNKRLRKLLMKEDNDEDICGYGMGCARSHHDYEIYAGINFAKRRLHKKAVLGIDPICANSAKLQT